MLEKITFYDELADQTLSKLTGSSRSWTYFLDSAAWLYNYQFHDQLLIHAQRPDARTCAELEFWNKKYNRWVRRGSKGIAGIDQAGCRPRMRYVFDVSDTVESKYTRSKPVVLWEIKANHRQPILDDLAGKYGDVSPDMTLAEAIHNIANQLAGEYYGDNANEIRYHAEGSILDPHQYDQRVESGWDIDDSFLRASYREMLANSTAYTVMTRCGIDPHDYFED
jgi:hypothetical protein